MSHCGGYNHDDVTSGWLGSPDLPQSPSIKRTTKQSRPTARTGNATRPGTTRLFPRAAYEAPGQPYEAPGQPYEAPGQPNRAPKQPDRPTSTQTGRRAPRQAAEHPDRPPSTQTGRRAPRQGAQAARRSAGAAGPVAQAARQVARKGPTTVSIVSGRAISGSLLTLVRC
jgi:hypothetical protein